ncbi:MAG: hypothetical protein ABSG67_22085 [Thermoguttaceae bacterium]|jgi:hypothetical protein
MNQSIQDLERRAVDAHARGERWETFWQRHADAIRNAEPFNRDRYRRLIGRLLHLLTTGEPGGQEPPSIMEPWEQDDNEVNKPADVGTQARVDWATLNAGVMK